MENLKLWCERYYEKTKLKVHPANTPLDAVCDELLGRIDALTLKCEKLREKLDKLNESLKESPIKSEYVRVKK